MGKHFSYLNILPGRLKIASIIFATITTGLAYYGFFASELSFVDENGKLVELSLPWKEICVLVVCALCLLGALIDLCAHAMSKAVYWDKRTAYVDFGFHMLSTALLLPGGLLMAVSAVQLYDQHCSSENACQKFGVKLATAALSLVTGLSYGLVGVIVYTNRNEVEH